MENKIIKDIVRAVDRIINTEFSSECQQERISINDCMKRFDEIVVRIDEQHFLLIMKTITHALNVSEKDLLKQPQSGYDILIDSSIIVLTLNKKTIKLVIDDLIEENINISDIIIQNDGGNQKKQFSDVLSKASSCRLWLFENQGCITPPLLSMTVAFFIMTLVVATGAITLPLWVTFVTAGIAVLCKLSLTGVVYNKINEEKKHRTNKYEPPRRVMAR